MKRYVFIINWSFPHRKLKDAGLLLNRDKSNQHIYLYVCVHVYICVCVYIY